MAGEVHQDPRQVPLPLPEPWRDGGGQLRLDAAYVPPAGPVKMTHEEYQDALAACAEAAAEWLLHNHGDRRDIAACLRVAREMPECSTVYLTPKHTCGYEAHDHARVALRCDCRVCIYCQQVASRTFQAAGFHFVATHSVMRVKGHGGVSRGYYLSTTTEKKPDLLTVEGICASVKRVKKASSNKWKHVARFLPREKDGRYRKYPGKCSDAGMVSHIEFGPHGNIHAHELRYGAHHYSEDLRAAAGGVWTHDSRIKQDPRGARGGVIEALKYVTKGSTKPGRREFVHPTAAFLFWYATRGMRLVEGYGTMRGLVRQAEEAWQEEKQGLVETDEDKLASMGPCPQCGESHGWTWERVTHPRCYVKPKPPPGGTAHGPGV